MARRRLKGPGRKSVALIAALAAATAATTAYWASHQPPRGVPTQGTVSRVVDGDTLHMSAGGAEHKLRLIGVDTPELHESDKLDHDAERSGQDKRTIRALGRRARGFTRRLCEDRACRLEFDPVNAPTGYRDRYGRLLAYVFLAADAGGEVFLNAEIIRQGYGAAMTEFPFDDARRVEFLRLQREARDARRGLWGEWKQRGQ
jgi:micrococcal nuclease